jgi:hypothetical protein
MNDAWTGCDSATADSKWYYPYSMLDMLKHGLRTWRCFFFIFS